MAENLKEPSLLCCGDNCSLKSLESQSSFIANMLKCKACDKQKQPGAIKKGAAKQSRNQEYRVALEMAGKNKG